MRNLLELTTILSVIVAFGALFWARLGMMAGGDINPDAAAREDRSMGASRALIVGVISVVVYFIASRLRKRLT